MKIRNILHKGLRRFVENGDASGLQANTVGKLERMISYLQDIRSEDELRQVPVWNAHQLKGDKAGQWSLTVTRNWRLTFAIDADSIEIIDLDYLDYH